MRLTVASSGTAPASFAGLTHSTAPLETLARTGAVVPKLHAMMLDVILSASTVTNITAMPPSSAPLAGAIPLSGGEYEYSSTAPEEVNC